MNPHNLKMTVLYRKGGTWQWPEVSKLTNGLVTKASEHPQYPEYLILSGHHKMEAISGIINGGAPFNATEIIGVDNKELPFNPFA